MVRRIDISCLCGYLGGKIQVVEGNPKKFNAVPWFHKIAGANHWIYSTDEKAVAFIGSNEYIFGDKEIEHQENAERIVECVNVCENIDVELIKELIEAAKKVFDGNRGMEVEEAYDTLYDLGYRITAGPLLIQERDENG